MIVVLPAALAMLAQAAPAAGGASEPVTTPAQPKAVPACSEPSADSQTIVICTERPQGYRLDPDVMEAKRETRSPGQPVRPGGKVIPDCTNVGPAPCTMAGVNLIGVALTAAEMAKRAASGEEIGSMFVTDPHPSEYQLYLMAKARREAEEEQKAALEKAKGARASQPAKQPTETPATEPPRN